MALAAAVAVTGWFVSPLISKLVLKGLSIFEDGMKGKLENLQNFKLHQIRQVIEKAEMLGREDEKLMGWMRELQDAAYEVDNILDDYDYELLERQDKGKFVKAVISPALSYFSDASFRSKLKDSLEKLYEIASRVNLFTEMHGACSNASSLVDETTYNNFITSSVSSEPRIFGRDAERDRIVSFLTTNHVASEIVPEIRDVPILPLVGVGGVGKTTLAQYVYNSPEIIKHFPTRMWIHLPQNFDLIMITKRMVESVSQDACPSIDNFDTLQQKLWKGIEGKRFLMVLDAVWHDENQTGFVNRDRWGKLLAPLRQAVQGSVVLITSRIDFMTFPNALQPIRLVGLNEHDCFSLFKSYAFEAAAACDHQQTPNENIDHHLMEIGREIARKIVSKQGGLPLAAKVVGGMLRNKHDVQEWNDVLNTEIWDDITRVLTMSYKSLPRILRQCVAHHGLYPKGLSFSGEYLRYAWMADGFIYAQQDEVKSGNSIEEIGNNCLEELEFRSFLQRTHDGSLVLHGLMHDVADSVTRHECTRIQKGEKKDIPLTTKHLSIHAEDLDEHKEKICKLKHLRTLFLLCDSKSQSPLDHRILHSILNKSKRLRTLSLTACHIDKLPDSIGDLKHLRFLDLSHSRVKTLPRCFHRLYHLKYLKFSRVEV